MKTNNKIVREAINKHILECVADYNENTFATINEASNHLYNEFKSNSNYAYNVSKFPNTQDRFSDYLFGLQFSFYYTNHEIETFINSLGINPENKSYPIEKSIKLYHYLIYSQTIKNL